MSLLLGCPSFTENGGRWNRYSGGGGFLGANPQISPDGTQILYSSPSRGNGDIFVFELASGAIRQLTSTPSYEGDASWSTIPGEIVFVRENEEFKGRIWTMDSDGNEQKALSDGPGYDHSPIVGLNGDVIFFSRSMGARAYPTYLHSMDRVTGKTNVLSEGVVLDSSPAVWNGDDGFLFMSRNSKTIFRIDLTTDNLERVTDGDSPVIRNGVMYFLLQDEDFQIDVWRMGLDSRFKERLTDSGGYKSGLSVNGVTGSIFFLQETRAEGIGVVHELDGTTTRKVFEIK